MVSALIVGGIALLPNTVVGATGYASNVGITFVAIVTVLGAAAGFAAGKQKAFRLKLQAQQILCQRQIEINTRA